jgi:hypothetical protein
MHPRLVSAAQRDNMDQVRLTCICLPKPDVILDQMLIRTEQLQGRVEGSTQNC